MPKIGTSTFSQLLRYFLLIGLVPVVVISFISYFQAKKYLQKMAIENLESISVIHNNQIESYIEKIDRDMSVLNFSPITQDAMIYFNDILPADGMAGNGSQKISSTYKKFFESFITTEGFTDIFLINLDGIIVYSQNIDIGSGLNINREDLHKTQLAKTFHEATTLLSSRISKFEFFPPSNRIASYIASPMFHKNKFIGVVVLQIGTDTIFDIINNYTGLGETGETVVASKKGEELLILAPLRFDTSAAFQKTISFGSELALPIQKAIKKEKGSGTSIDYRGKEVLAIWNYLPSIQWGMVTKIDSEEAFKLIYNFRNLILLIGALLTVILIGIIFILSKSISNPIIQLTKNIKSIGKGDLPITPGYSFTSEIGELADALKREIQERRKAEEESTQAKVEAENANLAKSEFLARMSHELRTPLNAIIGFSQVMLRSKRNKLNPTQTEDIEKVHGAGKHLLKLINEILDLSRIESGKIILAREPVNIFKSINEVLNLTQFGAEQKNIKIVNNINNQDIFTLADPVCLKQVLLNLISNSIKFNREGGTILLSCKETPNIRISVADTGFGVPEERVKSLFEPFARLHPEEIHIQGTGIGLSISKKLVELMHGKISYSRVEGEGSCFSIDLPNCDPPFLRKNKDGISPEGQAVVTKNISEALFTILYIEDNPLNLSVVEKILRDREDVKLFSAPEAELGLDLARANIPDLILMDIHLPGMSGLEALKYLQGFEETKEIPVIAISADAMAADIQIAKRAGFVEYLTKPIDFDLFFSTLDKYKN